MMDDEAITILLNELDECWFDEARARRAVEAFRTRLLEEVGADSVRMDEVERQLLDRMNLGTSHWVDFFVRSGGKDIRWQADWLKSMVLERRRKRLERQENRNG